MNRHFHNRRRHTSIAAHTSQTQRSRQREMGTAAYTRLRSDTDRQEVGTAILLTLELGQQVLVELLHVIVL